MTIKVAINPTVIAQIVDETSIIFSLDARK
jgi:hypothetical protein